MDQIQVKVVKTPAEVAVGAALSCVMAGYLYLAANPELIDELTHAWNEWVASLRHRFSIWQTLISIRSLPEQDTE